MADPSRPDAPPHAHLAPRPGDKVPGDPITVGFGVSLRAGTTGSPRSMARVQLISNAETMVRPTIPGLATRISPELALGIGVATGLLGAATSRWMTRPSAFVRDSRRRGEARIWRRPGVDMACWANFAAGGFRAMQSSHLPIVLAGAGVVPGVIAALIAFADLASTLSAAILVRVTPRSPRVAIQIGATGVAIGLSLLSRVKMLAGLLIGAASIGAGMLNTLGPANASDDVRDNERHDALAVAGTFRAPAPVATPAAVAGGLALVSLPVAMPVARVALADPALVTGIANRRRSAGISAAA